MTEEQKKIEMDCGFESKGLVEIKGDNHLNIKAGGNVIIHNDNYGNISTEGNVIIMGNWKAGKIFARSITVGDTSLTPPEK